MRVPDELTIDELWRELITNPDSAMGKARLRYRHYPGSPRCKQCLVPLGGAAAPIVRFLTKRAPSRKNPRYCDICDSFISTHPGGAEVECTLFFADVRGSTTLAERMSPAEFHSLIDRFHKVASTAVIDSDGLVDRLVGDEVVGLFMPLVGDHARLAVQGALQLLKETGHGDAGRPWVPVGIGIHTGIAYVGAVGLGHQQEFTALGDAVNVAARLASAAGAGELLLSDEAYRHAGLDLGELEHRRLELKGRAEPIDVHVVRRGARDATTEAIPA
jgi:adenylate cyclase